MIGTIDKQSIKSNYLPSQEVIEITRKCKKDYQAGMEILEKPWFELNDRTIQEDQNVGQMMFNGYVNTEVDDPEEAWKWRGTRSMARNKGIAMHAQLTANYLLPMFIAQNEDDEIDKDYSEVMADIIEWMAQPCNSNYQSSFLQVCFGMMYNPVTYLGAEFLKVTQIIKEKTKNGINKKEVLDEVLSGFNAPIYGATQILITNAYERNIQRQKAIWKRLPKEYDEMEAKYKDHPNWQYVQTGIKSVYNEDDQLFYDIKDEDHPNLVMEEIYYNRREDLEIPFVNGIYLGDDAVENGNPIKHRDNRGAPKYNITPFGYMRIGEHFFYYKSMMNALQWDNKAYDAMNEIVFNRAILEVEMPTAVSGSDKIDSKVVFPGSVLALEDPNSKVSSLLPSSNMAQGFNVLRETENSIEQGSVNKTMSGDLPEASQKAFNVAQAQANARKNLSAIGKSISESLVHYGGLLGDIVLTNLTTAHIDELTGGRMKLKYKKFVLEDKNDGKGEKKIEFDDGLIGRQMTEDEILEESLNMLEGSDYPKKVPNLRRVNPRLFAKHKFLTKIDIEEMFNRNKEYMQSMYMGVKSLLANDPTIDHLSLNKKMLYSMFGSDGEDLINEDAQSIPGLPQPQTQFGNQVASQTISKQINQPNII